MTMCLDSATRRNDSRTAGWEDALEMTELTRPIRRLLGRGDAAEGAKDVAPTEPTAPMPEAPADAGSRSIAVDIPETDPLLAYLQSAPGPVEVARLELDSPAVRALREAGVTLVVPLVSQGELIGTLNLGPRLSEQDYSTDDRRLLTTLAAQAAPAIRVAQLVREQAAEAAERERLEQEMRVATLIQQQFLPRELPHLPEWQIAGVLRTGACGRRRLLRLHRDVRWADRHRGRRRHRQGRAGGARHGPDPLGPARRGHALHVPGRDPRPGQRPARCPRCRRGCSSRACSPILEPSTGRVVLANAGHNLPYIRTDDGVVELRATGMPLGLLPGIRYEETEGVIAPGSNVLLYSDGIVEAHDPSNDMYGFPRLREAMAMDAAGSDLLDRLLEGLHGFTGATGNRRTTSRS